MKRPGAARCKLCVLFANACFSPALLSTAAPIWYRGMPEPLWSLRAPRPRLRAPGSGCCTRRLVHGDLSPSPGQAAGVGAGGADYVKARLWLRTRTAFRLMQDLGALSGALGL